jgi:hypothetical protein
MRVSVVPILCLLLIVMPAAADPQPVILVPTLVEDVPPVVSNAAPVPDFWTTPFNAYYSARLERYGDRLVLRDVVLNEAAMIGSEDTAAGYVIPLTLMSVEKGTSIELYLPTFPEYDPTREPYYIHIYFDTPDVTADHEVAFNVRFRTFDKEYETEPVEGHFWSTIVTGGDFPEYIRPLASVSLETDELMTEGSTELFLVVGVLADDAPDFAEIAEKLREDPPEGISVALPAPKN